jgi:hypothetical protein
VKKAALAALIILLSMTQTSTNLPKVRATTSESARFVGYLSIAAKYFYRTNAGELHE